jgi:hypothetical protein
MIKMSGKIKSRLFFFLTFIIIAIFAGMADAGQKEFFDRNIGVDLGFFRPGDEAVCGRYAWGNNIGFNLTYWGRTGLGARIGADAAINWQKRNQNETRTKLFVYQISLTGLYRLNLFSGISRLSPFIGGGGGYYPVTERQLDGSNVRYGGAGLHALAGMSFRYRGDEAIEIQYRVWTAEVRGLDDAVGDRLDVGGFAITLGFRTSYF